MASQPQPIDPASSSNIRTPFECFRNVTRKIVTTPKSELMKTTTSAKKKTREKG